MPSQYMQDPWVRAVVVESRTDFRDEVEPGLILRVGEGYGATKTWYVRYRANGRRRRLKLGRFPRLGLGDARQEAKKFLLKVDAGGDPQRDRLLQRKAETFRELAGQYLEEHAKVTKRTWKEDKRKLDKDVLPTIGDLKAKEVTRGDVKRILQAIAERGSPVAAHRTGALISRIFTWGITEDLVDANPAVRLPRFTEEESRERVLSDPEIAAVWKAVAKEHRVTRAALRFLILTGQRKSEVLELPWSELERKGEEWWWEIPGERTKNRRAHRVPISEPARAILEDMTRFESPWVFPSWKAGKEDGKARDLPMNDLRPVIRRAVKKARIPWFTPHDLRRTLLTGLAEMGFPKDVRKAVANHKGRQDVTQVYDRYDRARERRQALEAWGRRVMAAVEGKKSRNVLEFVS